MMRRQYPRKPPGPLFTGNCEVCGVELVRNHRWEGLAAHLKQGRSKAHAANTLCGKHYARLMRYGDRSFRPVVQRQVSEIFECRKCGRLCGTADSLRRNPEPGAITGIYAHGLCDRDYNTARKAGEIEPCRNIDHNEVLEEWVMIRDSGDTDRHRAASRIGLKWSTFDKILYYARKRGDARGSLVPFAHDMRRAA